MQPLVYELSEQLEAWAGFCEAEPNAINAPPQRLIDIRHEIGGLAEQYGQLPAYKAYRLVGQFEIDPDSLSKDEWFRNRVVEEQ